MTTLLHHPLCANSRKVRIALNEKNIPYELKETKYWEREESFMELNPAGVLPVLITDKNKVICGATPIVEYLEEVYDARNLMGRNPLQKAETRRISEWFSEKFYREVTKNLVWEKFFKNNEGYGYPNSKALSAGRTNIGYHLEYIEYLTKSHRFLNGDEISIADITAAAQLSVLDYYGDVPWAQNKAAKQWYSLVKSRPAFADILNDRIAGVAPVKHYSEQDF